MGRAGRQRGPALARALAVAGLVGLVTSCGASGGTAAAPDVPAAVVVPGPDCLAPEVLGELGLRLDPSLAAATSIAPAATAGAVPDDFAPTGVLVCQVGGQMLDGAGTWTAVTATAREGAADDLAALVAVLAAPAPTAGPCEQRPALALWLVDAMERAVRPSVPLDACGAPTPAVLSALDALAVTGVVDRPVELVGPSPDAA